MSTGQTQQDHTISSEKLTRFTRILCSMVKLGMPLVSALEIIANREKEDDKIFSDIIIDLKRKIQYGKLFSNVLKGYPRIFDSLYTIFIFIGEMAGDLETPLTHLSILHGDKNTLGTSNITDEKLRQQIELAQIISLISKFAKLGVPVAECIKFCEQIAKEKTIKQLFAQASIDFQAGKPLSDVFYPFNQIFAGWFSVALQIYDADTTPETFLDITEKMSSLCDRWVKLINKGASIPENNNWRKKTEITFALDICQQFCSNYNIALSSRTARMPDNADPSMISLFNLMPSAGETISTVNTREQFLAFGNEITSGSPPTDWLVTKELFSPDEIMLLSAGLQTNRVEIAFQCIVDMRYDEFGLN